MIFYKNSWNFDIPYYIMIIQIIITEIPLIFLLLKLIYNKKFLINFFFIKRIYVLRKTFKKENVDIRGRWLNVGCIWTLWT